METEHYAAIFNSVENSSCDQAHSDFCNTNIAFEMKAVIDDFASNKSPGEEFLQSSSNQFWFKPKHGTELCVFAFKELLRFYKKKHGSAMHVAFLDASNAFDRVNKRKRLKVVECRRIIYYFKTTQQ